MFFSLSLCAIKHSLTDKEAYSELTQTFKMEVLRNIANDVKRLTLDVWPAFKYVSEVCSPHVVFIKIDS